MTDIRTKVGPGGRVVIPAGYRRRTGIEVGGEVVMVLEDNELRLLTPKQAVARAQALVRKYVRGEESLAKELIEDRRREAERD
jgi:AbrB family looped-hinge helix DNA binding protein